MKIELSREDDELVTLIEFEEILRINKLRFPESSARSKDSSVEVYFRDTTNLDVPTQEQLAAIHHFNEHQKTILSNIASSIYNEREDLEEIYGEFNQDAFEGFPMLSSPEDIWKYISLETFYVHQDAYQDHSYIGIFGNCTWDGEHALGIIVHKNKVIEIGDWNCAYSLGEIEKDNYIPVAKKYSLDRDLFERNPDAQILSPSEIDLDEYSTLFDWLNAHRAIRGYRQTKADIPKEEKARLLLDITYLDLRNKGLSALPDNLNLLINMKGIQLSGNDFTDIPPVLFKITQLESIDLRRNKCTRIDPRLKELINLDYLDLSMNKLDEFPQEITELKRLENLYLSENLIQKIPVEISNLQELTDFRIAENKIRKAPSTLGQIPKLWYLDLMDNPISWIQKIRIKLMAKNKFDVRFEY